MRRGESFISLAEAPFSRRGSFFTFFLGGAGEEGFGQCEVWLGTSHGGASQHDRNLLLRLEALHGGMPVPYTVETTPYELALLTDYGDIRICIAETELVAIKCEGVGLRLSGATSPKWHETARDMLDGTWQIGWNYIASWELYAHQGSLAVNAPYDWRRTKTPFIQAAFLPDENGEGLAFVKELLDTNDNTREYISYDDGLKAVKADFGEFLAAVPELPSPYDEKRLQAAWVTWSHIMYPCKHGLLVRPMVQMMHGMLPGCYGWQQSYHAMALAEDFPTAWDLLLNMFDHQAEDGQLPDYVTDFSRSYLASKPPVQGVALLHLLGRPESAKLIYSDMAALYYPLAAWCEWWMNTHDLDGDGVPEYQHPDESGWDDSTVFSFGLPVASPDLSAYIVLLMEALGKLALRMGEYQAAAGWLYRSNRLLNNMLASFWNGSRFVAFKAGECENPIATDSICFYIPLILGSRLPADIIKTLSDRLFADENIMTPYGAASEALNSPSFGMGWMRGSVAAPVQMLLCIGLAEAGLTDKAELLARRYCDTLKVTGFYHIHNSITGKPWDKGFPPFASCPWTSWASSVYIFLASNYINE